MKSPSFQDRLKSLKPFSWESRWLRWATSDNGYTVYRRGYLFRKATLKCNEVSHFCSM